MGRLGVTDNSDPRWRLAIAERGRVGHVMAEARMRRGGGSRFEAEITSATFTTTCPATAEDLMNDKSAGISAVAAHSKGAHLSRAPIFQFSGSDPLVNASMDG